MTAPTNLTHDVWDRLAAAFLPDELDWLKVGGREAPFPKPHACMSRLDGTVGAENWGYTFIVTPAEPRPVYTCILRVRIPGSQTWVERSATSGEPHMGGKGAPDFVNAGKGGGTYAFRKAFQDGFCRYLSDPANWPKRGAQHDAPWEPDKVPVDSYGKGEDAAVRNNPPPDPNVTEAPCCECHQPAKTVQVKKAGKNHGRHFYTCPVRKGREDPDGCDFFEWAD